MRRLAAAAALILPPAMFALAVGIWIEDGSPGLIALAALGTALAAGWFGLLRTGALRRIGFLVAVLALLAAVVVIAKGDHLLQALVVVIGCGLTSIAARTAFKVHAPLPDAAAPERPVLFFNPKSGGGKAERFNLASEARARGIEPIELKLGADLERLVRNAVAEGADALAMAAAMVRRRSSPRLRPSWVALFLHPSRYP